MPLTLGLSFLLAVMESVYVMTGREIWRDATKFWGELFWGINFAMGVATGITMEFQFGTNWAYYAHYVGDIFGAPLAIEGLMAFFLEVDFRWSVLLRLGSASEGRTSSGDVAARARLQLFGLMDSHRQWVDAASDRRRVQSRNDADGAHVVLGGDFNSVGQSKFVHTVGAGYVLGSMFVLSISLVICAPIDFQASRDGQSRRIGVRPHVRAVVVSRRRMGLHGIREPEDEARGHRGDVGY